MDKLGAIQRINAKNMLVTLAQLMRYTLAFPVWEYGLDTGASAPPEGRVPCGEDNFCQG